MNNGHCIFPVDNSILSKTQIILYEIFLLEYFRINIDISVFHMKLKILIFSYHSTLKYLKISIRNMKRDNIS